MNAVRPTLLAVALLAFAGGLAAQQKDPPKPADKEPAAKARGYLPQGWRELGLSDDQKKKVYAIDAKYDEEIDRLKAQIEDAKAKKRKEQIEVLTPEQKKRLEDNAKKKATGGM